jgi:hypothetical protein
MKYNADEILMLTDTFVDQSMSELTKIAKKSVKELDPKAKVRNRGKCVFPADHPKVKDQKDHFPLKNVAQARNALARANQFSSAPEWFKGSIEEFVNTIHRAVKKEYPSIEVTEASKKPGKG